MIKQQIMRVKITFIEDLLGSWPADRELLTRYISSKAPAEWLKAEEEDSLPEKTLDSGFTVFPQDENGLFLFNFHLKGFLKEAGNVLKQHVGIKNLRSKIDNYVFIKPRKLYLLRDGKPILEPDDILERPLRAETMRGPRVTLIGSERVEAPVDVYCEIQVLESEVTVELIKALFDYGAMKGIGQWRNGGFGTFTWEEVKALKTAAAM